VSHYKIRAEVEVIRERICTKKVQVVNKWRKLHQNEIVRILLDPLSERINENK
jgi:hypothetical protein